MWQPKKDPHNPNGVHLPHNDSIVHGKMENLYNAIGYKSTLVDDFLANNKGMLGGICMDPKYAAVRCHDGKFYLKTIYAFVSGEEGRSLTQVVKEIDPMAECIAFGTVDKTKNILGYAAEPHLNGHENDYPLLTRAEAERLYKTQNPADSGLNFHGHFPAFGR